MLLNAQTDLQMFRVCYIRTDYLCQIRIHIISGQVQPCLELDSVFKNNQLHFDNMRDALCSKSQRIEIPLSQQ